MLEKGNKDRMVPWKIPIMIVSFKDLLLLNTLVRALLQKYLHAIFKIVSRPCFHKESKEGYKTEAAEGTRIVWKRESQCA